MDGLEIRRKRALYRANHRGTKELDLILGRYASERLPAMDEAKLLASRSFLRCRIPISISGFAALRRPTGLRLPWRTSAAIWVWRRKRPPHPVLLPEGRRNARTTRSASYWVPLNRIR